MDMSLTIALIGLVGVLIVALVNHRLTFWREQEACRKNASQKFTNSILTTLSGLYPIPTDWPSNGTAIIDILKSKFPALQAAVAEFSPFVPWYKKWCFERAWRIYRLGKDGLEIDSQYYWQYIAVIGTGIINGKQITDDNRLTYKSNFKKNVDRLLAYAK